MSPNLGLVLEQGCVVWAVDQAVDQAKWLATMKVITESEPTDTELVTMLLFKLQATSLERS